MNKTLSFKPDYIFNPYTNKTNGRLFDRLFLELSKQIKEPLYPEALPKWEKSFIVYPIRNIKTLDTVDNESVKLRKGKAYLAYWDHNNSRGGLLVVFDNNSCFDILVDASDVNIEKPDRP